jgi:hypothetical protein
MANKVEGQLIDLWNREEESTGLKGWLEDNISKKGISKLYGKTVEYQERGMAEEVIPGLTQGNLYGLVMGTVGAPIQAVSRLLGWKLGAKDLMKIIKDPSKTIKEISKHFKGKYSDEDILATIKDDFGKRALSERAKSIPKIQKGGRQGYEMVEELPYQYPKKNILESRRRMGGSYGVKESKYRRHEP